MIAPQPGVSGARACAELSPVMRQPAIKVRKIPKLKAIVKPGDCPQGLKMANAEQESAMQVVLGGGHPELVELIMGHIDNSHGRDEGCPEEKVMQGALSWASLNRKHRALFHHTHLKWWKALLKKHTAVDDGWPALRRCVVPHTSDKVYHACYVDIYRNLVRERKENEKQIAEAKARADARQAHWEAERSVSIRVAEEPTDHFEKTEQYRRWMLHQSKRDPRELELTKMMQRAERLVHHPKHEEDKSQSKECQEMGKLLSALRTRRREWEVFRTSPKPFTQMLASLGEAVGAMEAAMDIPAPNQQPPPLTPPSSPTSPPPPPSWMHR